jgi:CubicO group peptidase (beta-lactamase class C family)
MGFAAILNPHLGRRAVADDSAGGPNVQPSGIRPHGVVGGELASYIERARDAFNVPGIAVAVIKDGEVVFEQGFGKRNLEGSPVDVHTMFCIASNTKSFTATAIEMLADQGKLHLDDRVIDHLPWFRMAEPYATREMRIRDALAHRSGLGSHAGDLLFVPATTYSTREVVERLRDLPLSNGFRDSFNYENIMYAVATLVIEQASGQSFGDFVRQHIFQPVEMTESRIDSTYLLPGDNAATAYSPQEDGRLMAVPPLAWKNNEGAAGMYSSVRDMAKWAEVQLASGRLPDEASGAARRLFSAENQQRMWTLITPMDIDATPVPQLEAAQPHFLGYGEGWYLSDYRGQRLVWHTGGFPGTVSQVTLVPALRLGVVVLTNQQSEDSLSAITVHILDGYTDAPQTDWIEAYKALASLRAARTAEAVAKRAAEYAPDAKALHALASYAGTYRDRWFGQVDIRLIDGALRLRFDRSPRMVGSLSPWRGNTFLVTWDDRTLAADAFIEFVVGSKGGVGSARMSRASPRTASAYDYQDLNLTREKPSKGH